MAHTSAELAALVAAGGVMASDAAAEVMDQEGVDVETLMLRLLPVAAEFAQAFVSKYSVGAVVQGTSQAGEPGCLYLGANLEFVTAALQATVHAEQAAVNNAWLHGETSIQSLAVTAPPCGHCRQFLGELSSSTELEILHRSNDSRQNHSCTKRSFQQLLPDAFGPADLNVEARLLQPVEHQIEAEASDVLTRSAVAAAAASYAPYTGNYAGVALETPEGIIVTGRYAENAAFNPSLSPLASALSQLQMTRPAATLPDVVQAVLVEVSTSISQRSVTESLLKLIAPAVTLNYVSAKSR